MVVARVEIGDLLLMRTSTYLDVRARGIRCDDHGNPSDMARYVSN
jgi:hypothetical protein